MPEQFTVEEVNLICMFDTNSRDALIADLIRAIDDFEDDEMLEIIINVFDKVTQMNDDDFAIQEFYPIYEDSDAGQEV